MNVNSLQQQIVYQQFRTEHKTIRHIHLGFISIEIVNEKLLNLLLKIKLFYKCMYI